MNTQFRITMPVCMVVLLAMGNLSAQNAPQVAPSASSASQFNARRTGLEGLLRSGNREKIAQAFAGHKQWFSENPREAENAFWYSRPLTMPLGAAGPGNSPGFAAEILELVELSKKFKFASNSQKLRLAGVYAGGLCKLSPNQLTLR